MSYNILKYAFWVIICLPVFVLGFFLFRKLAVYNRNINRKAEELRKLKDLEKAQRRSFDKQYDLDHPGRKQ